MDDKLEFREKYQGIIKNYTNNLDQCAKQWLLTGSYEWLSGYYMYVDKIEEIKKLIVERESEIYDK
jgi:hypothetical protein|tara:strand:+ start:1481 stop:1678 length:198 start_codon:yes stop_codon:yes gene_type:complete